MNFTYELIQFQGVILSADHIHSFSAVTAKGGNKQKIDGIIEKLSQFLECGRFTIDGKTNQENIAAMRKFAFYIVLNAQLPILNEMIELDGLGSIISTTSIFPPCLMSEVMWNLDMDQFINEIISFTHPQLAVQVSDAFLDNFKYFNPLLCLDALKLLSSACYKTLTRLHLLDSEVDVKREATAAFKNFQRSIRYFKTPPNEHMLEALDKNKLYEYYGKRLHTMLLLITDCVGCFTSKLDTIIPGHDMYMLTYKEGTLKTNICTANVCDITDKVLLECLNACHNEMLDECKALVMEVSVDVFCGWSEVEEKGNTMQQTIGECCYKVRNSLLRITTISEHPLLGMMEQIARKPEDMEKIINSTTDDIILQNVDDHSENRNIWIQSLVFKTDFCKNLEFLKVISSNLNLFDHKQCQKLYDRLNSYTMLKLENQDYAESLMIKVFHRCSLSTKYMILDERFNNGNFLSNMKLTPDFTDSMTETFNKFIATPNSDLSDVLTLFLQNPHDVFFKVFVLATENMLQAEVMLKVMKMFERYTENYYRSETEKCIIKITQDIIHNVLGTTAKENHFIKFLSGLKEADILTGSQLLLLIIMTNMHEALITKNIESISFHVKLLKEAYNLQEIQKYRAPMLAMIGKILDIVRWKMNTFSVKASIALNETLELHNTLFITYQNSDIHVREIDWLKSNMGYLQPLNMYYYRSLWQYPGANYLDVISGSVCNNMNNHELSSWMSQVISSCTQNEWCDIWDSLNKADSVKLETFLDTIALITIAERAHRTENSAACLMHCYRNFVYIIRYKYFKEPLTDLQVTVVLKYIVMIVELIKDDLKEEMSSLLLPLFAYLSEKENDYSMKFMNFLNVNMKGCALTTLVNQMFSYGVA